MNGGPRRDSERLPLRDARAWAVLGLAGLFLLLGALFVFAPRRAADLFGLPAPEGPGQAYISAIGFRDVALALYMIGLTCFASRRAVGILLGLTVLIPVCDILLLAVIGPSSPWYLLLHAASAACFAALAWMMRA